MAFWLEIDDSTGKIKTAYISAHPGKQNIASFNGELGDYDFRFKLFEKQPDNSYVMVEDLEEAKNYYRQKVRDWFDNIKENGEEGGFHSIPLDAMIENSNEDIDIVEKLIKAAEISGIHPGFYPTIDKGDVPVSSLDVYRNVFVELTNRYQQLRSTKHNIFGQLELCTTLETLQLAYEHEMNKL